MNEVSRPPRVGMIRRLLVNSLLSLIFVIAWIFDRLWTSLFFILRDDMRHGGLSPRIWKASAWLTDRFYWVIGIFVLLLATYFFFLS